MGVILVNKTCPNCGKSHYRVNYSDTTAMYYTPVYKDGKLVSKDTNITTDHCTCLECGTNFTLTNK